MQSGWPEDLPQRFVFIVTYGRSGSTLLQNLLNALPGYQIRGENENAALHLAKSWSALQFSGQITRRRRSGVVSDQTSPWYGAEKIDPLAYGKSLAQSFTRTVLCPDPGTRTAGFKEIRWHQQPTFFWPYLQFLHASFPNAKFIFNKRNHAQVARSGWWKEKDADDVIEMLEGAENLYNGYIKKFPDRCHALRYEEYVDSPDVLKGLFAFLGEPFDAALVDQVMNQRLEHLQQKIPGAPL